MATITCTPAQAAGILRQGARNLERNLLRAEAESAAEGVLIAKLLSSGPYPQSVLTAMGHPYARRRPRPPMPPYIINRQTTAAGAASFFSAWRWDGPEKKRGRVETRILNDTPYGVYLENEKDRGPMIRRPILEAVGALLEPRRLARLAQAFRLYP